MCWGAKNITKDSKRIDRELKQDKDKIPKKILLLGTGNSGKSTFCKQLSLIYGGNNAHLVYKQSPELLLEILKENIWVGTKKVLEETEKFVAATPPEKSWPPEELVEHIKLIKSTDTMDSAMVLNVTKFFEDPLISDMLQNKGDLLHIPGGADGLRHHLSRLPEYFSPNFVPTDDDIVRVRIKTTGIIETSFTYKGVSFQVCDVGGQRSERRKWIQCFHKVDAIIYLVATNEYDTNLEEATTYNSMADSLQQWKVISELQIFQDIPFILFFNKIDLFEEKLQRVPLGNVFRDYKLFEEQESQDPENTELKKAVSYFERNYRQNFGAKNCYAYTTCALDKDSCAKVFETIQDVIIQAALTASGLNI